LQRQRSWLQNVGHSQTGSSVQIRRNQDLASLNQNGSVSVLLGNGDGTFQAAKISQAGAENLGIVAADFNNDGKTDIAIEYIPVNSILPARVFLPALYFWSSNGQQ
jgi:hypothetical protein